MEGCRRADQRLNMEWDGDAREVQDVVWKPGDGKEGRLDMRVAGRVIVGVDAKAVGGSGDRKRPRLVFFWYHEWNRVDAVKALEEIGVLDRILPDGSVFVARVGSLSDGVAGKICRGGDRVEWDVAVALNCARNEEEAEAERMFKKIGEELPVGDGWREGELGNGWWVCDEGKEEEELRDWVEDVTCDGGKEDCMRWRGGVEAVMQTFCG